MGNATTTTATTQHICMFRTQKRHTLKQVEHFAFVFMKYSDEVDNDSSMDDDDDSDTDNEVEHEQNHPKFD